MKKLLHILRELSAGIGHSCSAWEADLSRALAKVAANELQGDTT